ncbi:unnamed protein product [Acanthoscelides obtectus]|uniref:Kinase n=1 Tax=Acanthoscelides obtectus TaxID=200917 RepID=A0A9P0K0M3_ACAOB|nr:unnamed protein product [Acanthoscelides obtectus]CAK1669880.1 Inositol polyphosphate multikinase [Acanthoscelides obtectus]
MGKSEVQLMPVHRPATNLIYAMSSCNSICGLSTLMESNMEESGDNKNITLSTEIPRKIEIFSHQVAGHVDDGNGNYVGMFKQDGVILKLIVKKEIGEKETQFYKMLEDTVDKTLIELRGLVPKFYGIRELIIDNKKFECLALEDLTQYYKEPCIMDIKIGRRTWDPKATYEKIMSEEKKYHDCKRDLAFCIPGFQVYSIADNKVYKYGKDFGKSLDKEHAIDAIKSFLNAENGYFCRSLIVQMLASLWHIQHWARNQRRLRIYSSSLLLVYDAKRLREQLSDETNVGTSRKLKKKCSLYRPLSIAVLNNSPDKISTGFSGQLTKDGPILKPQVSSKKLINVEGPASRSNSWQKSIHTLRRTHSFQNNYDKDVQNKKKSYSFILDELCSEKKSECWATVKMIDFAHVYPAENCDIDKNYLEGIENLIKLFEDFLVESE